MWLDKYKPKHLQDIKGQEKALLQLKKAVQDKKPALLYGPVGSGKTSSAYALAQDLQYEILEINASDFRDKESIHSIVGGSLQQASLFQREKLVLIDEVDGISGSDDRGGVQAITSLLEKPGHAVVLICNDPWDQKFSTLRKKAVMIEFNKLNYLTIANCLKEICDKEQVTYTLEDLKVLARRCDGDLRSALIDLENIARWNREVRKEDVAALGEREKVESIFNALTVIFKGKDVAASLRALDYLPLDLHESLLWIDENLPKEYHGEDLLRAYEQLAKADVFNGRIRRWQYYRFYVYMNVLMTAGISLAKEQDVPGYVQYARTSRILKLWIAKMKYTKRRQIAEKVAAVIHCGVKETIRDVVPYLQIMCKHIGSLDFDFTEEEIAWLKK